MTQVYGLITDGKRVLIPKKAAYCSYWQGGKSKNGAVVNQAGQYALFGGKQEKGETPNEAVLREIKEESGVQLEGNYTYTLGNIYQSPDNTYQCIPIIVSAKDLDTIQQKATENIQYVQNTQKGQKLIKQNDNQIKDGEMQSVMVVDKSKLLEYLGKSVVVTQDDFSVSKFVNKDTVLKIVQDSMNKMKHKIDWYETIAKNYEKNPIVKKSRWTICKNATKLLLMGVGIGGAIGLTIMAKAYLGSNLKRSEKEALAKATGVEDYNLKDMLLKANSKEQRDIVNKLQNVSDLELPNLPIKKEGSITFIPENDHIQEHGDNSKDLIKQIKSRSREENEREVVFLERKEGGDNLGIYDVRLLANIIKHNEVSKDQIVIPEELKAVPIYQDALLYNVAIENGVKVIGAEGKGLKYTKELTDEYNLEREEYMTGKIKEMLDKGYNITMPVGAAHIKNLEQVFTSQTVIQQSEKKEIGEFTKKVLALEARKGLGRDINV